VPPRTVLVEWVGEPSPFDSEMVRALRLRGLLTPIHRLVLEKVALLRRARVDGHTSWTLGPRDGLSKTYRWGAKPGTYVQEVAFADVDRLLEIGRLGICRDLNQFRVVGSHADALPPQRADAAWAKVIARISRKEGLAPLPPGAERFANPERAGGGVGRDRPERAQWLLAILGGCRFSRPAAPTSGRRSTAAGSKVRRAETSGATRPGRTGTGSTSKPGGW
jgi:hypothetical protein